MSPEITNVSLPSQPSMHIAIRLETGDEKGNYSRISEEFGGPNITLEKVQTIEDELQTRLRPFVYKTLQGK